WEPTTRPDRFRAWALSLLFAMLPYGMAARKSHASWDRTQGNSTGDTTIMDVSTHEVINQVPELQGYNLLAADSALSGALQRYASGSHIDALSTYAKALGTEAVIRLGEEAEHHPPELETHDRAGRRIDTVRFHPAWHELMRMLREQGLVTLPYSHPAEGVWS